MYIIGSYVVSTLSGMRFVDFVKKRIFKPLGMSSSTYSMDAALQSGKFTGTWTSFGRSIPPWIEEGFVDLTAGPAGVISSVEELVRQAVRSTPDTTHVSSRPSGPECFSMVAPTLIQIRRLSHPQSLTSSHRHTVSRTPTSLHNPQPRYTDSDGPGYRFWAMM